MKGTCSRIDCGAEIRCRVALLALGVHWRRLEAAGHERFTGAGVYYVCTTVEADSYRDADVAVVGGGNSAGQAVMFLAECCRNRKVHLLIRHNLGARHVRLPGPPHPGNRQRGRSRADRDRVALRQGPHRIDHAPRQPQRRVLSLALHRPSSFLSARSRRHTGCQDDLPATRLVISDRLRRGGGGDVACGGTSPAPLETSISGVLAAGDIRSGSTKRVGFAVGDGSLAVTCTHRLISLGR